MDNSLSVTWRLHSLLSTKAKAPLRRNGRVALTTDHLSRSGCYPPSSFRTLSKSLHLSFSSPLKLLFSPQRALPLSVLSSTSACWLALIRYRPQSIPVLSFVPAGEDYF